MWLRRDVRCAAAHPVCALSVTQDIDGHRQTGDDMTQRKRTTADSSAGVGWPTQDGGKVFAATSTTPERGTDAGRVRICRALTPRYS